MEHKYSMRDVLDLVTQDDNEYHDGIDVVIEASRGGLWDEDLGVAKIVFVDPDDQEYKETFEVTVKRVR